MKEVVEQTLSEGEEANYFISISDLMASLLFIFIITLMAFVLSFQRATAMHEKETAKTMQERDRLAKTLEYMTNTRALRADMLSLIRHRLEAQGIQVEVDTEHGILHLTEQAIHFPSGKAELPPPEKRKLAVIAAVLEDILPCYAAAPTPPQRCDERYAGRLESVFIEGHTDNVPYTRGRYRDNWDLSAQRAMYTYRTMVLAMQPTLAELRNQNGFPVFGVVGYGEGRPRHPHPVPTPDAANRRIDLRFIMTPPRTDLTVIRQLEKRL